MKNKKIIFYYRKYTPIFIRKNFSYFFRGKFLKNIKLMMFSKTFGIRKKYDFDFYYFLSLKFRFSKVDFIDIGSNKGQSIVLFKKYFKNIGNIISIEPIDNPFLKKVIDISKFKIQYFQVAIGCVGNSKMRIMSNSGLNSLLSLRDVNSYKSLEIESNPTQELIVKCKSLDWVLEKISTSNNIKILKIDVQGFESRILDSSTFLVDGFIDFLIIELILVDKYENSGNYISLLEIINKQGFIALDFKPSLKELNNKLVDYYDFGQYTEMDALFIHKSSEKKFDFQIYS